MRIGFVFAQMWAALRQRSVSLRYLSACNFIQSQNSRFQVRNLNFSIADGKSSNINNGLLDLEEIKNVLNDVRADDVKVFSVEKQCDCASHMIIATGRSDWHVRNIAQALVYKVKQKQKGAQRMILPSVHGHEGGKWIVIDYFGRVIVHALDEKARAYYNLEELWSPRTLAEEPDQDFEHKLFLKIRPINNSKKKQISKFAS